MFSNKSNRRVPSRFHHVLRCLTFVKQFLTGGGLHLQRGVQWKHGIVNYMMLYTILLCNTTPIHCTPLPLQPPSAEYPGGLIPGVVISLSLSLSIYLSLSLSLCAYIYIYIYISLSPPEEARRKKSRKRRAV